jgi:hypothetical protein
MLHLFPTIEPLQCIALPWIAVLNANCAQEPDSELACAHRIELPRLLVIRDFFKGNASKLLVKHSHVPQ